MKCPKCQSNNPDTQRFCGDCGTKLASEEKSPVSPTNTLQTPQISAGNVIAGKYKIMEVLGRGGMGVVYKAKDQKLKRTVALKFLPQELTPDEKARERFIQEAQAAAALNHPHITTIYEIDEDDGQTFIAMEYIKGQSLKNKLESGPIPIDEAKDITIQVAEGLKEAHDNGIVHRDIKPANIMLTDKGQAKIMDFGIAKLSWGADLTKPSTIMGTVAYMSPEQARGEEVDLRSDIWSLGTVIYEMLTGKRPFQKHHEQALIHAILNNDPEPLSSFQPDIPAYIELVVKNALEKERSHRYKEVEGLIKELKQPPLLTFAKTEKSIVVLPFRNLSPEKDTEYFSDGLTEELITDLSHIEKLRVISSTSAMMLKGSKKSLKAIGRELDVQYALEGSVRKAGNSLRIIAQLIDVRTDAHLWADKYSGTLDDVFDIQEKVSHSIVEALKMKLSPQEMDSIKQHSFDNIQAYEFHLRARYALYLITEENLDQAIQLIHKGLEIAGENDILYADLGFCYLLRYEFFSKKELSWFEKVEECINKVFALNPNSAHGYALKGSVHLRQGDIQKCVIEFKNALAIDPNHKDALFRLGWTYAHSGKVDPARTFFKRLLEIDPLTPANYVISGAVEYVDGKFEVGLRIVKKAFQKEHENLLTHYWYGKGLAYSGRNEEAEKVFDHIQKIDPEHIFSLLGIFFKHALRGGKNKALASVTDELKITARNDEMFPIWMAETYALIGENQEAIDWLEHGVDFGFINYPFLNEHNRFLESIRIEPRYKKLMERIQHEWENFEV